MVWALHVYIVNPVDDQVKVEHIFYGETKEEALEYKKEHLDSCAYFRAAEAEERTDEEWEELDEEDVPTAD